MDTVTKIWRYVHGAMNRGEEGQFKADIKHNRDLQKQVDSRNAMQNKLSDLMPVSEVTEERIVDHFLQEYKSYAATCPAQSSDKNIIPFPTTKSSPIRKPSYWAGGLIALAAALMILLVGRNTYISPITWNDPQILQSATFRTEGASESTATIEPDSMKSMVHQLQQTIAATYNQSAEKTHAFSLFPRSDWALSTTVQETQPGKIALTIVAVKPGTDIEKDWTRFYYSPAELQNDIHTLADQIAEELHQMH